MSPIELKQRPPRSIGAELDYQTDLGPGTKLFWEHRNVFGAGERFRAELGVSEPQQSATLSLTKPDFFRSDQTPADRGHRTARAAGCL